MPAGEIDFVVGQPLTDQPWEVVASGQRIDYKRPFEECLKLAEIIIDAAMAR